MLIWAPLLLGQISWGSVDSLHCPLKAELHVLKSGHWHISLLGIKLCCNLTSCFKITTTWLAQLGEHRSAVVQTLGRPTLRVFKYLKRMCCLVMTSANSQTFQSSRMKTKNQVLSHSNFSYLVLMRGKRTHTTVRKEQGTQTPVVWLTFPWLGGLSVTWRDLNIHLGITS